METRDCRAEDVCEPLTFLPKKRIQDHPADYDGWGVPGWSWSEVEPLFKQLLARHPSSVQELEEWLANYSELSGHADMFVREVRAGSIEVDLIPWAMQRLSAIVNVIEQIQIVDKFVRTYGASLSTYIGGSKAPEATRSDLKDFMGAVSAIANVRTDAPPYRRSHSRMERRKSRPRSRSIHWRQGELRHKSKISDLCLRHRYMRTMSGY